MKLRVLFLTCLFFAFTATVTAGQFGIALLLGETDVTVEWDANATDSDLAQYRVYRTYTAGAYDSSKLVGTVDAPTTTFTDTAVPDGTWYWVVTSVDVSGNDGVEKGVFSNEITQTLDTTPPDPPTNLRFVQ